MIVTAAIRQSNGQMTHDDAKYGVWAEPLFRTGLPILLYTDLEWPDLPDNVTVIPMSIQDLRLWKKLAGRGVTLPAARNPDKDTLDYLVLQNSKTEFLLAAACRSDYHERLTWIDAGITRLFNNPRTIDRLHRLSRAPKGLVLPGCAGWPADTRTDSINWHYCGGFITADFESAVRFDSICSEVIDTLLSKLTWEVNVWSLVELGGKIPIIRYEADHNDSILNFPIVYDPLTAS